MTTEFFRGREEMARRALAFRVMGRLISVTGLTERAVGDEQRDDVLGMAIITRHMGVGERGVRGLGVSGAVARPAITTDGMMRLVALPACRWAGVQRDLGRMARHTPLRRMSFVLEAHRARAWGVSGNRDAHGNRPLTRRPGGMTPGAVVARGRLMMAQLTPAGRREGEARISGGDVTRDTGEALVSGMGEGVGRGQRWRSVAFDLLRPLRRCRYAPLHTGRVERERRFQSGAFPHRLVTARTVTGIHARLMRQVARRAGRGRLAMRGAGMERHLAPIDVTGRLSAGEPRRRRRLLLVWIVAHAAG